MKYYIFITNEMSDTSQATSQMKTRTISKKRTTKNEKLSFLQWYFDSNNHDSVKDLSGGSVSQLYQQFSNIVVSPTFVNRNRRLYSKQDGEIVKNSLTSISTEF